MNIYLFRARCNYKYGFISRYEVGIEALSVFIIAIFIASQTGDKLRSFVQLPLS